MLLWVRRYLIAFAAAFIAIAGAQLLRGRTAEFATLHGLIWSAISSAIFVGTQAYRARKQKPCVVCDATEMGPQKAP